MEENWAERDVKGALRAEASAVSHAVVYSLQGNGIDRADTAGCNGKGWREGAMYTLDTVDRPAVAFQASGDRANPSISVSDVAYCVPANPMSDRGQAVCYGVDCRNAVLDKEKTHTIQAKANGGISLNCTPSVIYDAHENGDYYAQQRIGEYIRGDVSSTLMARDYKSASDLVVEDRHERKYIVRRLTPTECARLQGFPDWWTDGVDGSDSAKYKLWGNGIALPCAYDVLRRISETVEL